MIASVATESPKVNPVGILHRYKSLELQEIPDEIKEKLRDKYELDDTSLRVLEARWAPKLDTVGRLYLPMITISGVYSGFTLRSMDKRSLPKSRIVLSNMCFPSMSVYGRGDKLRPVFLVEDQLSAAKLQRYTSHTAVALLGVHLDSFKASSIRAQLNPSVLVIALDKDAIKKSLDLYNRYRGMFPNIRVMELDKDIKDTPYQQVQEMARQIVE